MIEDNSEKCTFKNVHKNKKDENIEKDIRNTGHTIRRPSACITGAPEGGK